MIIALVEDTSCALEGIASSHTMTNTTAAKPWLQFGHGLRAGLSPNMALNLVRDHKMVM
jgi:hypothetical protein